MPNDMSNWVTNAHEDAKILRQAFGAFATGVTVVATEDASGERRAFTANSFTSVSLDPALILVCIGKNSSSLKHFETAASFSVSVLADHQHEISGHFASRDPAVKLAALNSLAPEKAPYVEGALVNFICDMHNVVDAGDHMILIGEIRKFLCNEGEALGFHRGRYARVTER